MKRIIQGIALLFVFLVVSVTFGYAKSLPGTTVEERAINGAKSYIKKHNLKNPTQTMLLISLFKNSQPKYLRQWEKLTGIKIKTVQYGYTDIPSKIMAEAVAKTGQYDIPVVFHIVYNQDSQNLPDSVIESQIDVLNEDYRRLNENASET